MSEILKVLNRKVELKSEVVEFNLMDNAEAALNDYYMKLDTAVSEIKGSLSQLRATESKLERALKETATLEKHKLKLEAAAKELGVTTSQWAVVKDLNGAIKSASSYKESLANVKKAISSL